MTDRSRARWVLLAMCTGTFMATLDTTVVNLGLHRIRADLGAGVAELQWVGRPLQRRLRRPGPHRARPGRCARPPRVFLAGVGAFALGTMLCAAAPRGGRADRRARDRRRGRRRRLRAPRGPRRRAHDAARPVPIAGVLGRGRRRRAHDRCPAAGPRLDPCSSPPARPRHDILSAPKSPQALLPRLTSGQLDAAPGSRAASYRASFPSPLAPALRPW